MIGGRKINIRQADKIKKASKKDALLDKDLTDILDVQPSVIRKNKAKAFTGEILAKYFNNEQSDDDIKAIIKEATYHFLTNR